MKKQKHLQKAFQNADSRLFSVIVCGRLDHHQHSRKIKHVVLTAQTQHYYFLCMCLVCIQYSIALQINDPQYNQPCPTYGEHLVMD